MLLNPLPGTDQMARRPLLGFLFPKRKMAGHGVCHFPEVPSAPLSLSSLLVRSPGAVALHSFLTSALSPQHAAPTQPRGLLHHGPLWYSATREQRWQDWALWAKPETKQVVWMADQSPAGPCAAPSLVGAEAGPVTGRTCW